MMLSKVNRRSIGSALVSVLASTAILTTVTGSVLLVVSNRRNTLNQSALWQEALVAAEAGVHQAVAQLERALSQDSIPEGTQTFTLALPHGGEFSNSASVQYRLTRVNVLSGGMERPYYRLTSTGVVGLPGSSGPSLDKRDVILRKLNLGSANKTAVRTIEAWAKPQYNTDTALKTEGLITLNNHKIFVDSFNSEDPNRSVSGRINPKDPTKWAFGQPSEVTGEFNVEPHNIMRANIATNSEFIAAGNASIYGDAMTNGGTVGNSDNILGEIRDDYYEEMAPVHPPKWSSSVTPGIPVVSNNNKVTMVTDLKGAAVVRGGTAGNPARYVVNSISLSGSNANLTFSYGTLGNSSNPDFDKNHIELYVRGNFVTKGGGNQPDGAVTIENGVYVTIWVLGDLNLGGNGMANQNGIASSLTIYGVNAPNPTPGQTFTFAGSSRFYGTVYAPSADLKLAGGGGINGTFVGSLTGRTAFLNGNTHIRYDEALAQQGMITRFGLASWFEDTRLDGKVP